VHKSDDARRGPTKSGPEDHPPQLTRAASNPDNPGRFHPAALEL